MTRTVLWKAMAATAMGVYVVSMGIGCSGGGGGLAISVSVAAPSTTVLEGMTTQVTATVTNDTSNKGVSWSASCSAATCGTVSPKTTGSGVIATYTAPGPTASDLKVTVTAASVADSTKSQGVTITVPTITVAVNPTTTTVDTNATAQFGVTVGNDPANAAVNWTLTQNGSACSPGCGSVSPTSGMQAVYTAPASLPSPATVTLTATSVTDGTKSAPATITVTLPPIAVTLAPKLATVAVSKTAKLTATVQNDRGNQGVTWNLTQGTTNCAPGCGTIAPANTTSGMAVVYTAPGTVPATSAVTVKATSVADGTQSDTATVNVVAVAPNAVPLINQILSPVTAKVGGPAFTLTVSGTGFANGATVNWNGSARSTTYVSNTEVQASVIAADIAKAGTAVITVINPNPGGGTSNQVFFETTLPSPTLAFQSADSTAGGGPSAVATADFNGDGKLDLAVSNFNDNSISILLGNGDGTFKAPVAYGAGANPFSVATGDFNGDGKLDLAVGNVAENTVSVFLGNGDGTFQNGVKYTAGNAARTVVLGDFNADGKLDIAVANQTCGTPGCGPGVISILLGNGDGTFQTHSDYSSADGPTWMTTGDFNQDGVLDLAVTGGDGGAGTVVSILLGNGDGTFQAPVNYTVGTNPAGISTADLNKDGKLDLAVANNDGSLSILMGNGDGTFQEAVNYSAGGPAIGSVVVADMNGDGIADVAIANGSDSASVYLGNGDGTFQQPISANATATSFGVAAGDFNQDGRLDLAIPNQGGTTVTVAMQLPTIVLTPISVAFNPELIGSTTPAQQVTMTNPSALALTISSITIAGDNAGDFAQTNNCGASLASGASCTVSIIFTPSQIGARTATLTLTDTAAGSPQSLNLTGIGVVMGANATISQTSLAFATQLVGTTSTAQVVTITNYGTASLGITGITVNAPFAQTNNCGAALATAASCAINVSFAPASGGAANGTLTIVDNAPGSPQNVTLSGLGTFVELVPGSLNFGQVRINSHVMRTVTLANTASTALTINSITLTGFGYSETTTCGSSVAAGGSCTISVTFSPNTVRTFAGAVTIADSDPASPQTVSLTGRGKQQVRVAGWRTALSEQQVAKVPAPMGSKRVGTRTLHLVDSRRDDPFLPKGTKREVLVRLWYPTASGECKPAEYTAATVWRRLGELGRVTLPEVNTSSCQDAQVEDGPHAAVVFTPGYTATISDYTFLMEDLASRGYIVAAVGHTYEATAMEFPDGRFAESMVGSYIQPEKLRSDDATLASAVLARMGDVEFVMNELTRLNAGGEPLGGRLDPSRVALAGHSLGGLTALLTMQFDSRFRVGVLLDPYVPDRITSATANPVLFMTWGATEWTEEESSLWNALRGKKLAVNFEGTEHTTPTDAVWLVKAESQVGPMGQEKTVEAMRRYIAAFLDANLRGEKPETLPLGGPAKYPSVEVRGGKR
jgi:dienelactone hydrolase